MRIRFKISNLTMLLIAVVALVMWFSETQINRKMKSETLAVTYLKDTGTYWTDTFKTTMYTTDPSECGKQKSHPFFGITFSGRRAVPNRTVAVDPKVIPLGSLLVDVETGQILICDDTGGKIKGHMIDLFLGPSTTENRKKMDAWGCRNKQYIVIESRKGDKL